MTVRCASMSCAAVSGETVDSCTRAAHVGKRAIKARHSGYAFFRGPLCLILVLTVQTQTINANKKAPVKGRLFVWSYWPDL